MRSARRLLRGSAIFLLAVGLVWGGLEAGSGGEASAVASPPAPYWAPGEMPEYPGGLEYPLGDGIAVNGVPMRITHFEVKANPERVRDFYVDELERRGLFPSVLPGAGRGWTVSALSEDASSQIVVSILEDGRDRARVLPSIVSLGSVAPEKSPFEAELPKSENAAGVMETTSRDRPGEATLTYQEPSVPAPATAAHIRAEMVKRGWHLSENAANPGPSGSEVIETTRDRMRARFTVTPWTRSSTGAVVTAHFDVPE